MKRTEAETLISEKLQKQEALLKGYANGSIGLKCLCDNLAIMLLYFSEKELGMLPPHISKIAPRGQVCVSNEWEPESWDKELE